MFCLHEPPYQCLSLPFVLLAAAFPKVSSHGTLKAKQRAFLWMMTVNERRVSRKGFVIWRLHQRRLQLLVDKGFKVSLSFRVCCSRQAGCSASRVDSEPSKTVGSVYVICETNDISCHWSVIKTTEFMFAGINMFWARLRLILAQAVRRGLKWALRRAQCAQELKLHDNYHFGGHWENKNWKKNNNRSLKDISFINAV